MTTTRRTFIGGLAAATTSAKAESGKIAGPELTPAQDRADYHYAELVKALDEATEGYDGWDLRASIRRSAYGREAHHLKHISVVSFDVVDSPPVIFERHQNFA